ncbi:MAG: biopolymer transporter ExbD [Planctomycetaceae bacterium]|jgi:biopolymer transport protein ExbD|nr:biopolymer transporter ExbD [Planctomycetaceae bacterium]MBT6153707.1 biopolymer transporter ExbD [Planctomycetaceae bacterium]MBT6484957.1 biopolymer transporter ExbD [Planctomycetaceae bacterium]MBT6493216.1 biopolymer transporter ExbD [Planctomycetaceae bacterium]
MKQRRRNKLLIESPASATGDIAFNLIVFFLVCASVQPDSGRKQTIPKAETVPEEKKETENISVDLTRTTVAINSEKVDVRRFPLLMRARLRDKKAPEDRVVVVKSAPEVPYDRWIDITAMIEDAGGIITLQLEEEREVTLPE